MHVTAPKLSRSSQFGTYLPILTYFLIHGVFTIVQIDTRQLVSKCNWLSIKAIALVPLRSQLLLARFVQNRRLVVNSYLHEQIERYKELSGVIFKSDFSGELRVRDRRMPVVGFAKEIIPSRFKRLFTQNSIEDLSEYQVGISFLIRLSDVSKSEGPNPFASTKAKTKSAVNSCMRKHEVHLFLRIKSISFKLARNTNCSV